MKGAAVGLALLDAVALQAGTLKIDGLRIVPGTAPQSGSDAFQRGRGLLVLGDVPAALAAFRQAMLADPQSTGALNGIAVCYDRLGRYDISRSYYEAALAIDPNSAVILNNFGYSLYLQGDLETAITHLIAARDADDAEVSAASRRTLAMIAAQPHNADADPSATVQLQPAPVAARIERTSGSEVRLVFGDTPLPRTAAPRRAVATAAAYATAARTQLLAVVGVAVAAPVTPLFPAPVTPPVELAALNTPVAIPLAAPTAAVAPLPPAAGAALDADVAAAVAVAAAWTPKDDARLVAEQHALDLADAAAAVPVQTATAPPVPVVPADIGEIVLAAATAPARSRPAAAPVALAASSPVGPRPRVLVEPRRETLTPWIVTGQFVRAPRPAPAVLTAPELSGGDAVFASDDPVLNEFAARMRRRSVPAGPTPLDRDQAIALLETIIARVRTS